MCPHWVKRGHSRTTSSDERGEETAASNHSRAQRDRGRDAGARCVGGESGAATSQALGTIHVKFDDSAEMQLAKETTSAA